jgi:hypothetical protein
MHIYILYTKFQPLFLGASWSLPLVAGVLLPFIEVSATESRRNKVKGLLKKTTESKDNANQNRDNTHNNDKKEGYIKTTERREMKKTT